MFVINKLLIKSIFIRVLISFILCNLVIFITGGIADSYGYAGVIDFDAWGPRTQLAASIFRLFPSYGYLLMTILLLSIISSTVIFISIRNYINEKNSLNWYLILYLPSLLIYASSPSKESLFFIPSLIYIIIESEHLINNKNNLFIYIVKILLLFFMYQIRGILALPYIFLAIISFLFKTFNLNFLMIRRLKFFNLLTLSIFISIISLLFIDPDTIYQNANSLNNNFDVGSILTRRYDMSLLSNIYNPLNFIRIQFLSFYPSILETIRKPHTLLITYESTIFLFLFYKTWNNLFFCCKNDNKLMLLISIIFILVVSSYFLMYGLLGYMNLGSSQRFKANFIPISLIFPLISNILIRKKLSIVSTNK